MNYISGLQDFVQSNPTVGKTIAVTEIIKTVHRELLGGDEQQYRIPSSTEAVAQTLITFQNSHRSNDLWHYVTPDFDEANVWFQLKSGDNQDMIKVEKLVDKYFLDNPPPVKLEYNWFGMTHINVVWQERVTVGVVKAFAGSFLIIMVTLMVLFRSVLWGLLAMVPLSFTVAAIDGLAGLISGNLDTPLAILTSVSIGLAVDYSIHFIVRCRQLRTQYSNWKETIPAVFGEPSRAITRNVIVVGVGFLPLLLTPLIPYQMTAILLSSILVLAGIATLLVLPAIFICLNHGFLRRDYPHDNDCSPVFDWFEDDELAMRLYRNFSGVEAALYYYNGFWKSPAAINTGSGSVFFPVLQVLGASLRSALASGVANLEFGVYKSKKNAKSNPISRNSEFRLILGFEKEIASEFTVGVQYSLERKLDYDRYLASLPDNVNVDDKNRSVMTLRLTKLMFRQDIKLSLFNFYSASDGDSYLRMNAYYKLSDDLKVEGGINHFYGEKSHTLFSQFKNASNIYTAIRYEF